VNNQKIKYIQLYAERHTGSKWFEDCIKQYLVIHSYLFHLGWKHFFPDIYTIDKTYLDEYLFIVLSRNPYDWTKSMNENPYHAHISLRNKPLNDFIKMPWISVHEKKLNKENDLYQEKEMYFERNPQTLLPFTNIIEMRNMKNQYFINLKNIVSNIKIIRYEDICTDIVKIMSDISDEFKIYKTNRRTTYNSIPKMRKEIDEDSLDFINKNINWEVEKFLGYEKRIIN
jgi:hypothetical protein